MAVSVLMALYLAARTARRLLSRPASTNFDVVTLFLLYTCAQGTAVALLLRFVPAAA
jgi:cytochrome c oxidase subunit I+III